MSMEPIIELEGNVVADPRLGATGNGTPAVTVRVAVTPRVKQGEEWVDGETQWIDVEAFGALAENAAASLLKGTRVFAKGRLRKLGTFKRNDDSVSPSVLVTADVLAPSLRNATAQVVKREGRGGGGGGRAPQQPQQAGWASQQPGSAPASGGDAIWGEPAPSTTPQQQQSSTPW